MDPADAGPATTTPATNAAAVTRTLSRPPFATRRCPIPHYSNPARLSRGEPAPAVETRGRYVIVRTCRSVRPVPSCAVNMTLLRPGCRTIAEIDQLVVP